MGPGPETPAFVPLPRPGACTWCEPVVSAARTGWTHCMMGGRYQVASGIRLCAMHCQSFDAEARALYPEVGAVPDLTAVRGLVGLWRKAGGKPVDAGRAGQLLDELFDRFGEGGREHAVEPTEESEAWSPSAKDTLAETRHARLRRVTARMDRPEPQVEVVLDRVVRSKPWAKRMSVTPDLADDVKNHGIDWRK